MVPEDTREILTVLARRSPMVRVLAEGPVEKRVLEARFDVSRSTVNRAIRELEDLGLVERVGGGYRATAAGRLLIERFDRFEDVVSMTIEVADLLAALPPDARFDPDVLVDATVVRATSPNPNRPLAEVMATVDAADRVYVLGKALAYEPTLETLHDRIRSDTEMRAVFDPALLRYFESKHVAVIEDAAESDTTEFRKVDALPYSLLVVDVDGETHGYLVLYESAGNFRGLIHNDTAQAVAWFLDVFESYWAAAEPA